ncbi:DUF6233 domain-containing protein [Streptomyces purpurascens]|uniref:DUF6233 domain-containing protein n=1 Tax=Streptomyces purpurascens TaxID=1924 RepID=UPI003C30E0A4
MAGSRRLAVSRDEARRLLSTGLRACSHCQPDVQPHILDLLMVSESAEGVADGSAYTRYPTGLSDPSSRVAPNASTCGSATSRSATMTSTCIC